MRESLLSMWRVDIHQALRMWEDQQIEVELLSALYVSFDRLGQPVAKLKLVRGRVLARSMSLSSLCVSSWF